MPYKDTIKAKEHARQRSIKYRKLNREKINANARERTKNDPIYRQKMIDKQKKYALNNRKKILAYKRSNHLKVLHGITPEEYKELEDEQVGLCAICRKKNISKRLLAVDHNHKTGELRGLLCDKCNLAIGLFDDNIKLLKEAITYIRYYEDKEALE